MAATITYLQPEPLYFGMRLWNLILLASKAVGKVLWQVLRSVNVRDIVPMLPGISKEEQWKLDGTPVDGYGLDVFENLKLLGRITTEMWRIMMSLGFVSQPSP